MGFPCGLQRRMCPQPIPVQYPPLLGFLGPACAAAGATAAHAGVAATLELACRPRRRLAHGRVGAGIGCDSSPGLSQLSSIPELMNSLSGGRPCYDLVSDSNLDWNQGFLDVENFVRQRGLTRVLIDEYGFSEPSVYVPEARFWNCQEAAPEDGGQWAI